MTFDTDVLVAGGGPTGLMLANELRTAGIRCTVIERGSAIDPTLKAGAIGPLGAEALRRRGLGDALDEAHIAIMKKIIGPDAVRLLSGQDAKKFRVPGGHFAGIWKIRPDARADGGAERRMAVIPQQVLEQILEQHLAEPLPHAPDDPLPRILRGAALTGFAEDADGITVDTAANSGPGRIRARFLVGCDGGRSTVRKLAGFAFPGTEPTMTGHQIVAEYANPEVLEPRGWRRTPTGMMCFGPTPGRLFLARFDGPPADRDAPITLDELQAAARDITCTDITITGFSSATRFTDNTRLADGYRRGRVLLAGDAAHVHSPFGGQGLNLGLMDAVNLGWKLAAVVRGEAGDALLDSYTAERHPVAERVLANTRAQIALMRPGPHVDALREVIGELLDTVDPANAFFGAMLGGLDTVHPMPYAGPDEEALPLLGRPVPDLELADGSTLYAHSADGRPVLLGAALPPEFAGSAADRVHVLGAAAPGQPVAAALIRPDGIVAWSAATAPQPGAPADPLLAEALAHWFAPAAVTA
ncbi:hypothetical protein BIV57_17285 [Mangrovactinospora gilvigrisea]|uniref:FAD-binding domain-containing protein n=1 Tax=Mangrovactinospora gilvigrisea TaxID=1428644 RepID=A0A1J7C3V7_9ACTN|nr:FAD-dependent monooxygenase [Mangrovactinospora gilvigrisea]OIV36244.1 hypothetical protein BIV57_17285 [Mangrovactinospora gilvigrisea]